MLKGAGNPCFASRSNSFATTSAAVPCLDLQAMKMRLISPMVMASLSKAGLIKCGP